MPTSRSRTHERLAEGFRTLEEIKVIRAMMQDPSLEKALERRIVYRELVELELQDMDDQLEWICNVSAGMTQSSVREQEPER